MRRASKPTLEGVAKDVAKVPAGSNRNTSPAAPHYEFGGPVGAGFIVLTLPGVVLALYYLCGREYCLQFGLDSMWAALDHLPGGLRDLVSPLAGAIFLAWFLFQVLLDRILPGETVDGVALKDGSRLKYKMNGHLAFWVSLLAMGHGMPVLDDSGGIIGMGPLRLSVLYDYYAELAVASIVFSFALSVALYVASFRKGAQLAKGGTSGNAVYDFYMGRELNPRIGGLDLKCFCELRPGLIGWTVLNLGMACKQYERLGYVSLPMILVNLFQGVYVWDALHHERSILTTMDITTDGFGFMLVFGDLCWVPFVYSLQARCVVDHNPSLPTWACAAICALNFVGYAIFRGANGQKDAFRRDPKAPGVSHLSVLKTKRGTKLLISGWWGMARKINYTGDWIMGLSWCLTTGFVSPVPYFYCVYFGVLLVHRALRDDVACHLKYGSDWDAYKHAVPNMFVPGLF